MTDRKRIKRFIRVWIIIIVAIALLGYASFQAKNFVKGPTISVDYPKNGETVSETLLIVTGTAKNLSFITLNGNKIFTDEAGVFKEKILLSPGYNIVTIWAQDRFGRTTEKQLQITQK